MPRVRIENGLNVHYSRAGEGPDLVLIHGIIAHLGNWHYKVVPMLWDSFNVLTYDLRGHGDTEFTETGYTARELAGDLKGLLDALGIERTYVVGHSLGADVALYFAYLYPERVREAVLIEPTVPAMVRILTRQDFKYSHWLADALEKIGVPIPEERRLDGGYMLRKFIDMPVYWGPMKGMPKSEKMKQWMTDLFLTTSLAKDVLDVGELTLENIPRIRTRIHLIHDRDSILWRRSYDFLRKNLPNATTQVIRTGTGDLSHLAPLNAPEVIAESILKALPARERVGVR
jgi:pimeloyl-ACP methyl ester carboxylesterase